MSFDRRAHNRQSMARRRELALGYLGGVCKVCGVTEDLEFDHIDPATKVFTISRNLNRRWEVLVVELDKCQLLCRDHHLAKSRANSELGGGQNKLLECPHGTISGYGPPWKCRCEACRTAKKMYRIDWESRREQAPVV